MFLVFERECINGIIRKVALERPVRISIVERQIEPPGGVVPDTALGHHNAVSAPRLGPEAAGATMNEEEEQKADKEEDLGPLTLALAPGPQLVPVSYPASLR
jgi:hypothetical protein